MVPAAGLADLTLQPMADTAEPAGQFAQAITETSGAPARAPGGGQPGAEIRLPVTLIAVNIARHAITGTNRFALRLDPPELGRVDIQMQMSADGRVNAHLTAERPETLDLLQRDARALERALNDAGLDADKDSLSFSLKQQGSNRFGDQQDQPGNNPAKTAQHDESPSAAQINAYRAYLPAGRLDISV